jgi:hypothetical protein
MNYGPKQQVVITQGEYRNHTATIQGKGGTYDYQARRHIRTYLVSVHTATGYRQATIPQNWVK